MTRVEKTSSLAFETPKQRAQREILEARQKLTNPSAPTEAIGKKISVPEAPRSPMSPTRS